MLVSVEHWYDMWLVSSWEARGTVLAVSFQEAKRVRFREEIDEMAKELNRGG